MADSRVATRASPRYCCALARTRAIHRTLNPHWILISRTALHEELPALECGLSCVQNDGLCRSWSLTLHQDFKCCIRTETPMQSALSLVTEMCHHHAYAYRHDFATMHMLTGMRNARCACHMHKTEGGGVPGELALQLRDLRMQSLAGVRGAALGGRRPVQKASLSKCAHVFTGCCPRKRGMPLLRGGSQEYSIAPSDIAYAGRSRTCAFTSLGAAHWHAAPHDTSQSQGSMTLMTLNHKP